MFAAKALPIELTMPFDMPCRTEADLKDASFSRRAGQRWRSARSRSLGFMVAVLGLLAGVSAAHAATATLPTNAAITGIGATTTVDLSLNSGAATEAADIDIAFNSGVIAVSGDAVTGPLTNGCQVTTNAANSGVVRIGVACVNAVSANGVFVRLTFQSITTGTSALNITRCSLNEDP